MMALHEAVDEAFASDDELYIRDELGDDDSCTTTTYASSRTNSLSCLTASEFEGDSPDGQIVPVPVVPQQPVLIRQQTPSPSQLALSSPNILDSYSRKVSKLRSLNKRHLNHIR